jgi:hypothetical protein
LRGVLIRIGRFKSLESQYSKVHLKPIKKLWEDLESRERANKSANEKSEMERMSTGGDFQSSPTISFSNWLPSFYDGLISLQMRRMKWRGLQVVVVFSQFHLHCHSPIGYQAFMMSYYFILNKNGNGIITDVLFYCLYFVCPKIGCPINNSVLQDFVPVDFNFPDTY